MQMKQLLWEGLWPRVQAEPQREPEGTLPVLTPCGNQWLSQGLCFIRSENTCFPAWPQVLQLGERKGTYACPLLTPKQQRVWKARLAGVLGGDGSCFPSSPQPFLPLRLIPRGQNIGTK